MKKKNAHKKAHEAAINRPAKPAKPPTREKKEKKPFPAPRGGRVGQQ